MNEEQEKIVKRVLKLLELANSPYPEEAQSAILKAEELMAQYNIQKSALSIKLDQVEVTEEKVKTGVNSIIQWHTDLITTIAKAFRVKFYYATEYRSSTAVFVGEPEDVIVAKATAEFGINTANILWKEFLNEYKRTHDSLPTRAHTNALKNDYMRAFIRGTKDRLNEQIKARKELVPVIRKEVIEKYEDITKKARIIPAKKISTMNSLSASVQGYLDGKENKNMITQ